ncbi:MAG: M67 family metallopeptidase [Acidimicrobiia bacterium]
MRLSNDIRGEIVSHARSVLPEEACGLLAVDSDGCVRHAYCLTNVDRSSSSFTLDPDEHYASLVDAESRGWVLGGSFHSHPRTAAVPSQTDISRALEPDWVYLIVGLADPETPELRGWWIRTGVAVEEPIEVVPVTEGAR